MRDNEDRCLGHRRTFWCPEHCHLAEGLLAKLLEAEQPDHLLGEVDTEHVAPRTHFLRGWKQRRTPSGVHVEHRFALPGSPEGDQPGPEVREEGDDDVLGGGGTTEDSGDLFGVVVHGGIIADPKPDA